MVQQVSGCTWLLCAERPEISLTESCPGGAASPGVQPGLCTFWLQCDALQQTRNDTTRSLPTLHGLLWTKETAASVCFSQTWFHQETLLLLLIRPIGDWKLLTLSHRRSSKRKKINNQPNCHFLKASGKKLGKYFVCVWERGSNWTI